VVTVVVRAAPPRYLADAARLGPESAKGAYLPPPKYGHPEDVLDAGTWSDIVTIDPIR